MNSHEELPQAIIEAERILRQVDAPHYRHQVFTGGWCKGEELAQIDAVGRRAIADWLGAQGYPPCLRGF